MNWTLKVKVYICEIIDKNFEYTKRLQKTFETEFCSKFEDYRNNVQEEREPNILTINLVNYQFKGKLEN